MSYVLIGGMILAAWVTLSLVAAEKARQVHEITRQVHHRLRRPPAPPKPADDEAVMEVR